MVPGVTTDSAPLSASEYRSLAEFRYALRRFLAFSEQVARDHGLSPAHHQLLLAVRGHEATSEPADIGTLAEWLQLKANSASELVDRAAARGLVERTVDPADKRRALVTTTDEGRALLEDLSRLHRDEIQRFRHEVTDVLEQLGSIEQS